MVGYTLLDVYSFWTFNKPKGLLIDLPFRIIHLTIL